LPNHAKIHPDRCQNWQTAFGYRHQDEAPDLTRIPAHDPSDVGYPLVGKITILASVATA